MQTPGGHLREQRPQPEAVTTATVDAHDARNAAQLATLGSDLALRRVEALARRVDALEAAFEAHAQHG